MSCCQNSYNGIPCCCPESIQVTTSTTCPFQICCEPECEDGTVCSEIYYTDCVRYDGPAIPCHNINPGDTYTQVLEYIISSLSYICNTTTTTTTNP